VCSSDLKEIPPAPQPVQPAPGCTGPTRTGTDAPMADVKAALLAAGHHQFWNAGNAPDNLKHALPAITVPDNLIKAFGWQESGWQSTILACDGGIGTMQLMPGTVQQINDRFNASLDVHTLSGNTMLGAAYIEWLTVYFGAYYFGENYDLSTVSPIGPSGEQYSLLQMVTAAYNVGPGTLEQPDGKSLSIPSGALHYSNNVIALMSNCPCSQY